MVHGPDNGVSEGVWVHDAVRRRHSHYEQQRSRPNSMGSESTVKARSQRASYQEPKTSSWDLSEFPAPPVPALRTLSHGEGSKAVKGRPHTNFSRRTSFHRETSANSKTQNSTENDPPPPVPSHPEGMDLAPADAEHQQQPDVERDTMQSPDSGPPFAARRTEDYLQKTPLPGRPPGWLSTLYTISHLIFFSIIGTLARLGVQWFAFYPGTPIVTPVIWANVGGSFLMGFLSEDWQLFRDEWTRERFHPEKNMAMDGQGPVELSVAQRTKIKKTVPLYIGLTMGFCG